VLLLLAGLHKRAQLALMHARSHLCGAHSVCPRHRTQDWTTSCVDNYGDLKKALQTSPQVTDGKVSVSVCSGCDATTERVCLSLLWQLPW
jgi:hypothetical protein